MNEYLKDKKTSGDAFNEFMNNSGGYAFSESQFKEMKEKLNVKNDDELLSIGLGGFILKSKKDEFKNILNLINSKQNTIKEKMKASYKYAYDAFMYELNNHEYIITYDILDTLHALELKHDEINQHKTLKQALKDASEFILNNSCWDQ